jgi:FkbM family methyltransferase
LNTLNLIDTPVAIEKCRIFERLRSSNPARLFVLGRNKYAKSIVHNFDVEGFVDDYTDEQKYMGRPIIRMSSLPSDCVVVSCVVDGRPLTAIDRLYAGKATRVLDYFTLLRLAPELFEQVDYCANNRSDILANLQSYQWVYDNLADEESKISFSKVVQFRYSFDLDFMRGFSLRTDHQYFEEFVKIGNGEVFVDGGAYDGQTTLDFSSKANSYQQIYCFEPAPEMIQISKHKLGHLKNIQFIQKGLFSREDSIKFDATAGSASRISDVGATQIKLTTLDKEVTEPISMIKLDIEGAEFDAINGAVDHIKRSTPTIAICVYHNQSDFWRIPKRIMEINDRYKIYLRHYSEGILETVMFFIPKK